MGLTDILNNTILIPTGGSLSNLPANKVAENLGKTADYVWGVGNPLIAYVKDSNGSSKKLISIQSLSGFGMKREVEKRAAGGSDDYVINLPGSISYSDVTIRHLFSRDKFFLDWIKNGIMIGGAARADIEIHINAKDKQGGKMIFTLCDAFPIKWSLMKELGIIGEGTVLFEDVTLTYSKATFSLDYGQNN